jgi:hypothetical protein
MSSRGNDSVRGKALDRADPTAPEAPVAKRQLASRSRWLVGLCAGTLVVLVLVVCALLYRTNRWLLAPGIGAEPAASASGVTRSAGF